MGKHDRTRKDVNRLQLRREVIRVLTGENLGRVVGGMEPGEGTITGTCWPSKPRTVTTGG